MCLSKLKTKNQVKIYQKLQLKCAVYRGRGIGIVSMQQAYLAYFREVFHCHLVSATLQ